jgi:hypothetical protein
VEAPYTDRGELSAITFAWMVDLCTKYLDFDKAYLKTFAAHHEALLKDNKKNWAQGMINDSFEDAMALGGSITRAPGQYDAANKVIDLTKKSSAIDEAAIETREYIHPSARIRLKARLDQDGLEMFNKRRDTSQVALAGFEVKIDSKNNLKNGKKDRRSGLVWVKNVNGKSVEIPEYKIKGLGEKSRDSPGKHYFERRLLKQSGRELEEVKTLTKTFQLPEAPKVSYAAGVTTNLYKAVLGYLPSSYHFWENDK